MQATTIKLENPLLGELKKYTPKTESLTSFIRGILEQELKRRKMTDAAEAYVEFLSKSPEEQTWLQEWEEAELSSPPKDKLKKRAKK